MLMTNYFAHAKSVHSTNIDSLEHLFTVWYSALSIYVISVIILGFLFYILSNKSFLKTYVFISALLLISGIFLYDFSPAASATGITLGFFSSMLIVYSSITKP